jgi:cobalt-zinc-cadmium efflux system membrane fusion protein
MASSTASPPPRAGRAAAIGALLGAIGIVVWAESSLSQSAALEPRTGDVALPAEGAANDPAEQLSGVAAVGTVELDPEHVVTVTTRDAGVVSRIVSFEGDTVREGALLAVVQTHATRSRSYDLVAPISGTVVERAVTSTQAIEPDLLAFKVSDLDYMRVTLRVPGPASTHVRVGDRVEVQPFSAHELRLEGRIAEIHGDGPLGATLNVRIANRERHLSEGQGVKARVFGTGKS